MLIDKRKQLLQAHLISHLGHRSILMAAALLAFAATAHAHQPYESSAIAELDHDRLELTVITSAEIASQLVGQPATESANLQNLRPEMLKASAELYELTAAGKPLKPERILFNTREGEAIFTAIYPVANIAEVHFRAAYLDKLPQGYGASINVIDETGKLLGRQPLLRKGETRNALSVNLQSTAIPASTTSPAPATEQSLSPPAIAKDAMVSKATLRLLLATGIGAVLFLFTLACKSQRRSPN